ASIGLTGFALRRVNSATPLKRRRVPDPGPAHRLSSPSELGDPIEASRPTGRTRGSRSLRRVNSATPLKQDQCDLIERCGVDSSPSELGDPIEAATSSRTP